MLPSLARRCGGQFCVKSFIVQMNQVHLVVMEVICAEVLWQVAEEEEAKRDILRRADLGEVRS